MQNKDVDKIVNKYKQLVALHGIETPAAGYDNIESQYFRFKILTEIANLYGETPITILDYGCGLGDLFFYLFFNGFKGKYIGVDITPEIIQLAKQKYGKYKQANFYTIKAAKDVENIKYDYALVSGVFNDKISDNQKMFKDAVSIVFKQSKLGVAFNLLSTKAKRRYPTMYYYQPGKLIDYCLDTISDSLTLRHDYRGGNFTVYLYKKTPVNF